MVFTNGFANAKESVQGIPAIFSSIPSWQTDPFIFSPYAANQITSLPGLLKEKGYQSFFFHGGFNGTMGFDSYAALAGFDNYIGMDEYDNADHYDGTWGIWDEEFLQFAGQRLQETKLPFFAGIFTLNTHNPYVIPEKYKTRFSRYKDPFLNCVQYLDYSLGRFFAKIQTEPWFRNTLFVITADHTAPFSEPSGYSMMDDYRIPLVFYHPEKQTLRGERNIIANQIDIMPSVLDLLHFDQPFFSFGKSLFRDIRTRSSLAYNGQIYQYLDAENCYHFNGAHPVAFYRWTQDSGLVHNLYKGEMNHALRNCDSTLKKNIQFFSQSMLRNRMHAAHVRE
jgi:phosphoglycerol transferase MdoB-like AlkP superfamily enzyme